MGKDFDMKKISDDTIKSIDLEEISKRTEKDSKDIIGFGNK